MDLILAFTLSYDALAVFKSFSCRRGSIMARSQLFLDLVSVVDIELLHLSGYLRADVYFFYAGNASSGQNLFDYVAVRDVNSHEIWLFI